MAYSLHSTSRLFPVHHNKLDNMGMVVPVWGGCKMDFTFLKANREKATGHALILYKVVVIPKDRV